VGSVSVLVCDWERVGLCQIVGAAEPTLVPSQFGGGCDRVLYHLCQTEWESKDETGDREAHGIRKLCALHHPALRLFDVTPKACSAAAMAEHNEAIIRMQGKNIKKKGTLKGASATNSIAIDIDDNSTQDEVGADHSGETIESAKPPSTTYNVLADSSDDEDVPFLHQDKDDPDWRNSEIFNDDEEDS
jgi:hypothetical protein